MVISGKKVTEKLIQSHKRGRDHLLKLIDGITEEQWFATPGKGRWSIQRAATHIVNAELMWMSKRSRDEPEYLGQSTSIKSFILRQDKTASILREKVRQEGSNGFTWIRPQDDDPSYHWSMIRVLQHAIYHTGMISLLRQQVGAPKLDGANRTWTGMVDSIFESVVNQ